MTAVRERGSTERRQSWEEEIADAKALRPECAWHTQRTAQKLNKPIDSKPPNSDKMSESGTGYLDGVKVGFYSLSEWKKSENFSIFTAAHHFECQHNAFYFYTSLSYIFNMSGF